MPKHSLNETAPMRESNHLLGNMGTMSGPRKTDMRMGVVTSTRSNPTMGGGITRRLNSSFKRVGAKGF
jgi:hypothetical protein